MNEKPRNAQMVKLSINCAQHGAHIVYLASIDGMAEQVASFFADRGPFDCEVVADELPLGLFGGGPLGRRGGAHNR